jgi:hypothetical protein
MLRNVRLCWSAMVKYWLYYGATLGVGFHRHVMRHEARLSFFCHRPDALRLFSCAASYDKPRLITDLFGILWRRRNGWRRFAKNCVACHCMHSFTLFETSYRRRQNISRGERRRYGVWGSVASYIIQYIFFYFVRMNNTNCRWNISWWRVNSDYPMEMLGESKFFYKIWKFI